MIRPTLSAIVLLVATGCGAARTNPAAPTAPTSAGFDPGLVGRLGSLLGGKAEQSGKTVKVSFPRADVAVEVDGWTMPPFMGLTSWVAFTPGEKPDVEAMIMGDLVLFEDEVNPVMSALLDGGVEVTALHNHFFYDKPKVFFMHVGGEGSVDKLGRTLESALATERRVREKAPQPAARFEGGALPATSAIDAAELDAIFGVKGTAKDGMYKAVMGRKTTASCGCAVGKAEGVSTWAAFGGAGDNAVVDGDFAVLETELQPVLRSLRASGIDVVAIHHHMTGESPRILFLHYWGHGKAAELARAVRRALDLTAWDAP